MDARKLLLGDWSRVVRDPLDLLRIGYAVAIPVLALARDDYPLNLTISAALVLAVRPVNLPRPYDWAFALALGLTGFGDALGLYDRLSWYDLLVHALVPFFLAPTLYVLLARIELVPDLRDYAGLQHYAGVFIVTLALGLAVGAVWEILEWSADRLTGSDLSRGNPDTIKDLMADGLGALFGGLLLVVWTVYGWGSVRRIPGDSSREDAKA